MTNREMFSSIMDITPRPPIVFTAGEGSWLKDTEGRVYLDFIQGWAVNSLGHCPQIIQDALAAQAARVINVSPAYYNEPLSGGSAYRTLRSGSGLLRQQRSRGERRRHQTCAQVGREETGWSVRNCRL